MLIVTIQVFLYCGILQLAAHVSNALFVSESDLRLPQLKPLACHFRTQLAHTTGCIYAPSNTQL